MPKVVLTKGVGRSEPVLKNGKPVMIKLKKHGYDIDVEATKQIYHEAGETITVDKATADELVAVGAAREVDPALDDGADAALS